MIRVPMYLNDDNKELATLSIWRRDSRGNNGRKMDEEYIYDAQLVVMSWDNKRIVQDLHTSTTHLYGSSSVLLVAKVMEIFSRKIDREKLDLTG